MKSKVLFITYDGLTDPLGQSQILPYYLGLAQRGYQISILSAEKKENFETNKAYVAAQLKQNNILWRHVFYSNQPPVISTFLKIKELKKIAFQITEECGIEIVHCRSIIPAMIGDTLRKSLDLKLIFDIRGFWADERVEGGIWNLSNPLFGLIYKYFKRKEKQLFNSADYIISLTENAKNYIQSHFQIKGNVQVIPCCVDIDHFSLDKLDQNARIELRKQFNLTEENYVLCYVGSLGTRYLLKEMLLFFKELYLLDNKARFLFISKSDTSEINAICNAEKINRDAVIITSCEYRDIPSYISIADASVFFIKTSFSGKAASPTKQAEVMSLGLPIVANSGLGDTDEIINDEQAGIIINEFSTEVFRETAEGLINFKVDKGKIRSSAIRRFSLEKGIDRYQTVYEELGRN